MNKMKKQIQQYEIISFDLFDTLIIRPYWQPKDLFLHLEYLYNAKGFCKERIKAEKLSRKNLGFGIDTTLDRIYQFIPEKYRSFKEKELELEYDVLQINAEVIDFFNYAKSLNKKIIITSDMYLPIQFIEKVLSKLNINGYSKIYLSCEYKKTKFSGKLYKQVINDFNTGPWKILHIGDNRISDFLIPKFVGIKSFLYTKIKEQFVNNNSTFKNLIKNNNLTLGLSISTAVCAINWHKQKYLNNQKNYFYNLGFNIGGMVAYSFCRFAIDYVKQNNIEKVFFVARGGYVFEKIFNLLAPGIKTDYVVFSRIQNSINKLINNENNTYSHTKYLFYRLLSFLKQILNIKFIDKIINKFYPMDLIFYYKVLLFIKNFYPDNKILAEKVFNVYDSKDFYLKNKEQIDKLFMEQLNLFDKYLENKCDNSKNILILDDCAVNFSAQKLCVDSLKHKNFYGLYFQSFSKKVSDTINVLVFNRKGIKEFNWEIVEFLFTAPTPPILGINKDFNIIYENINNYEKKIIETYKYLHIGILDFAENIKDFFKDRNVFINSQDTTVWINNFLKNYTKNDYKNMLGIYTTPDQIRYFPLFSYKPTFREIFSNPINYLYNCSHVICPTLLQRVLSFPIRVLRYIVNYY